MKKVFKNVLKTIGLILTIAVTCFVIDKVTDWLSLLWKPLGPIVAGIALIVLSYRIVSDSKADNSKDTTNI